jgi:hypothetical protein
MLGTTQSFSNGCSSLPKKEMGTVVSFPVTEGMITCISPVVVLEYCTMARCIWEKDEYRVSVR